MSIARQRKSHKASTPDESSDTAKFLRPTVLPGDERDSGTVPGCWITGAQRVECPRQQACMRRCGPWTHRESIIMPTAIVLLHGLGAAACLVLGVACADLLRVLSPDHVGELGERHLSICANVVPVQAYQRRL